MQLKASIVILTAAIFAGEASATKDRVLGPHVQGSKIQPRPTLPGYYEERGK